MAPFRDDDEAGKALIDIAVLRKGHEAMAETVSEGFRRYDLILSEIRTAQNQVHADIGKLQDSIGALGISVAERRGRDRTIAWLTSLVGVPIVGSVAAWSLGWFAHGPGHP